MMDVARRARGIGAAGLVLFGVLAAVMSDRGPGLTVLMLATIVVVAAVLAWRGGTGWPLVLSLVVPVAGIVVLAHDESANLGWMSFCVTAGWVALSSPLVVAMGAYAGLALVLLGEWLVDTSEPGWAAWFVGTTFTLVACVFARRLRETVVQLEAAQHQLAERSRAEERSRIAGEVHDVIGHALTVSLLHISSARLALDEDPDEARRALEEAERLARTSLDEVRATVGLMRTDASGEVTPLPVAADIGELVESFRNAGADVGLTVAGDLGSLGSARGLAAYRIVQEALTNATRHAPGEPVTVEVSVDGGTATVVVRNTGDADPDAPVGNGLLGMRERAEGVGGRLRAGAESRGWLVEAVLPA
jgi:signal transduction histidine kinase